MNYTKTVLLTAIVSLGLLTGGLGGTAVAAQDAPATWDTPDDPDETDDASLSVASTGATAGTLAATPLGWYGGDCPDNEKTYKWCDDDDDVPV